MQAAPTDCLVFHKLYGLTTEIQWTVERSLHAKLLGLRKQTVGILEVFSDPDVESPWLAIGPGRSVCSEPWSQSRIDLARRWLRDCDTSHGICPRLQPRLLPTRVLDIGADDQQMRLRAGNDGVARYVALSHCWGGHAPVQTTKATLESRFQVVNLDSSSQTLVDAAQVCRDLDIRYLWIDSLCIVQDDEDDWAREAGNMSELSRNATLTISAEGARNAKEGLFKQAETSQTDID